MGECEAVAADDRSLLASAQSLISDLRKSELSIVTAESCTAGMLAATLAQAEGAGDCLQGGFVTYTKEQKTVALGVDAGLLERDGSVTEQVIEQMLEGALSRSKADIAVAVSGVLGPEEDEDGNPVGLMCIGAQRRGREGKILRLNLGREGPRSLCQQTIARALDLIGDVAED